MSRVKYGPLTREICEFAVSLGYSINKTTRGHIKFTHPRGHQTIFTSGTPSDHKAHKNCKKQLERNLNPAYAAILGHPVRDESLQASR